MPTLFLKYPRASELSYEALDDIKVIGIIYLGTRRSEEPYKQVISEQIRSELNTEFDPERHIIIPMVRDEMTLGSGPYVVIEIQ